MKTIKMLALVSTLSLGFAGAALAQDAAPTPQRGDIVVAAAVGKAVVVGPIAIHAYTQFSTGSLYTVKAVTGTDLDCANPLGRGATTTLDADNVESFTVGAGEVACVTTTASRGIELLWHARPLVIGAPASIQLAKN